MSVCAMMFLTVLGLPAAVFGLGFLFTKLRAVMARSASSPRSVTGRLVPAFAVIVPAIVIAVAIGQGWRTSHPCGQASAAATSKLPRALACLAP